MSIPKKDIASASMNVAKRILSYRTRWTTEELRITNSVGDRVSNHNELGGALDHCHASCPRFERRWCPAETVIPHAAPGEARSATGASAVVAIAEIGARVQKQ